MNDQRPLAHASLDIDRARGDAGRLAALFRQAPGFVGLVTGPEHRFEFVNDPHVEVFGDYTGRTVREALPELAAQGFVEVLDRVRATGERHVATAAPIRAPGAPGAEPPARLFDFVCEPMRDAAGAVTGIFCAGHDVTERALAESALRASEARYRALFESIDEGFCVIQMLFDAAGRPHDYRFVDVNPAFERHTGLAGAAGRTVRKIVPTLETHWFEAYGRVALTGESARFQLPAESLSGRWFDVFAFRIDAPEQRRVAILFSDITQRVRAEVALRESEERFRLMADAVPQIVWITDADGRVEFFNRQWSAYTGAPYEPTTAAEVAAGFVHPDDGPATMEAFDRARREDGVFSIEHRVRSADGAYRWFLVRAEPYRDERSGRIVRWFGASVDIHDRKMAEEALREADRRKDEFLAMLAHELRNPLAPLTNALRLIERTEPLTQAGRRTLAIAERQRAQLGRLVDDLLEVSRISRGKIELRPEPFSVAAAVHAAVDARLSKFEERGLAVTVSVPQRPVRLTADPARFAQVLDNLLSNAAKFTPAGGAIRVEVEDSAEAVELRVSDSGAGIAPDQIGRLFELFSQLDATLDRAQGGLGIGLALVRRLVELHGGTVSAASDGLGRGATFTVRLPTGAAGAGD